MDTSRYKEYLQSDQWKKLKAQAINRDNGTCQGCGEKKPIEVHHLTYERIGDELLSDLLSLCCFCHERIHNKHKYKSGWSDYIKGKSEVKPVCMSKMTKEERDAYIMKVLGDMI